jgi:hypothetical protein
LKSILQTWIVVPAVCILAQSLLKMLDNQLRVKASSCHRPGVKSKERSKFIER